MVDVETLLQPVFDDSPDPPAFGSVRERAAVLHRRRAMRRVVIAVVVIGLVAGAAIAATPGSDGRARIAITPPTAPGMSVHVGRPATFAYPAMNMISAFDSVWISQPDRLARVDPASGRIVATIPVKGTSDFRNLAAGAGAVWIDDTGTQTVTRIDPIRNAVAATIRLADAPLVVDGLAFVDGKLWIARPEPTGPRGDVVAIDPATNRVVTHATIPRTFDVMSGGTHALWYVRDTDLLRFDTSSLRTSIVRHDVKAVLTVADQRLWLLTSAGVIEADERTGATIGSPIVVADTVNLTAAVGSDVVWLAAQPGSSSPGTVTGYDLATHRAVTPPVPVGLPVLAVVDTGTSVWVDAGGLTRIPVSRADP